jgi:hypothetical protein
MAASHTQSAAAQPRNMDRTTEEHTQLVKPINALTDANKPSRIMPTTKLTPPFQLGSQLTTDGNVELPSASSTSIERERLLRTLRDEDLELMHSALWYAGRKSNISPLHHQRVLRRDVVLTEKARLHLTWFGTVVYIKRLEDELLNWTYFANVVSGDWILHQAATGFLLSYARLVEYPSDLEIAQSCGLINKGVSWQAWRAFRVDILACVADRQVHDRFEYGELRLCRLNQIYRMKGFGLSYFTVHREYSSYFGANYMTLVTLFALVSVALSAMQVMSGIDGISTAVTTTSYRFAIATLLAMSGCCAVMLALYFGLYVWNWCLIFVRRASQ